MQIYQEELYDLLCSDALAKTPLALREHPHTGLFIEGLKEQKVRGSLSLFGPHHSQPPSEIESEYNVLVGARKVGLRDMLVTRMVRPHIFFPTQVKSPADVKSLLAVGRRRLVVAETKMNRHSSRSHAVSTIKVSCVPSPPPSVFSDAYPRTQSSTTGSLSYAHACCPSFR